MLRNAQQCSEMLSNAQECSAMLSNAQTPTPKGLQKDCYSADNSCFKKAHFM